MIVPFSPAVKSTVNISVAATSNNVQVTSGSGLTQIRVMNNGSATAWITFGNDNTVTADTTTCMAVPPGGVELLSLPSPVWAAAIAAGSTGAIYFTPGEGV